MSSSNQENSEKAPKSLLKSPNVEGAAKKNCKSVTFADTKGQRLVHIRNFAPSMDDISYFQSCESPNGLPTNSAHIQLVLPAQCNLDRKWITYFRPAEPGCAGFYQDLGNNKVVLEALNVVDHDTLCNEQRLEGAVRVLNLGFEKCVIIRGTYNNWITYFERKAKFKAHYPDSNTDLFEINFELKNDIITSERLMEFAVSYSVNGVSYWDNNHGNNYRLYQI